MSSLKRNGSKPVSYIWLDLSLPPLERIQKIASSLHALPVASAWGVEAFKKITAISASEGKAEFEMTVSRSICNQAGFLHGGCAATILDVCTMMCSLTEAKPGYTDGGSVSRSFLTTFLYAIPIDIKVRIVCESARGGKKMSNTKGEIRNMDGKVAITFPHDKVQIPSTKM